MQDAVVAYDWAQPSLHWKAIRQGACVYEGRKDLGMQVAIDRCMGCPKIKPGSGASHCRVA